MRNSIPTSILIKSIADLDAQINTHKRDKADYCQKMDLEIKAKRIAREQLADILARVERSSTVENAPDDSEVGLIDRSYEIDGIPVMLLARLYRSSANEAEITRELVGKGKNKEAVRKAIHRVTARKHISRENGELSITADGKTAWENSPIYARYNSGHVTGK